MDFEKLMPLANTYDDKIIWDFLKTKDITKDNIVNNMEILSTTGCNNEECELSYDGADQEFLELNNVGYDFKNNKFIDIEKMLNDDCSIDRKILDDLDGKGIEPLEYFQFYYCPSCHGLDYYIE